MNTDRELAAILFSDISEFTHTMDTDEKIAMGQVLRHNEIISLALKDYHGHLIKDMGDGQFIKFSSAVESVQCAIRIQELTKAETFSIRIGIHLGDVLTKNSDVFGSGVNIASRIHTASSPGSICISKEIWLQIKNQSEIESKSLGEQEFKGINEKIEVFELLIGDSSSLNPVYEKKNHFNVNKIFLSVTGLLLTIIGGAFWIIYFFFDIGLTNSDYSTSIAILEIKNISSEANSIFAEGLTEELISQLTRIQNLKVTPRTDIARYKDDNRGTKIIAKELDVEYIVEGSVGISGDDIRVIATLINALDQKAIWSETYKDACLNAFEVQNKIAHRIITELNKKITKSPLSDDRMVGIRPNSSKLTKSREAVEYVSLVYEELQNTKYHRLENAKYALSLLNNAIQRDSTYGEAYALMALSKFILLYEIKDEEEMKKKLNEVRNYVDIALRYDPKNELALAGKSEFTPLKSIDGIKNKGIYDDIANKLLDKVG